MKKIIKPKLFLPIFLVLNCIISFNSFAAEEDTVIEIIKPRSCFLKKHDVEQMLNAIDIRDNKKIFFEKSEKELSAILSKRQELKAIGSYNSYELVQKIAKQSLSKDIKRIISWMNSPDSRSVIYLRYKTNKDVGYGLHRNSKEGVVNMNNIMIILKKNSRNCTFSILNSYPISEGQKHKVKIDNHEKNLDKLKN